MVDLGHAMTKSHMAVANGKSDLEASLPYLWDTIGAKVASGRKTVYMGLVGVGTEGNITSMELNRSQDLT